MAIQGAETSHLPKPQINGLGNHILWVTALCFVYRAKTILSGVIVRPDPEDPGSTRLSMMLQTDMRGWIPHFVVNAFAAKAPSQWQTCLTNYFWNTYSKQQGREGEGQS